MQWSVREIQEALTSHGLGSFAQSGQLYEAVLGDDRVQSVLHTRVLGLLGLPWSVKASPRGDRMQAHRAARILRSQWSQICPSAQLAELVRSAVMMGFAVAELVWSMRGGLWHPTLRTWSPQHIAYRMDLRQYVVLTDQGPVEITPGDGKWMVYTPQGDYRGWMSGAVRAVAIPWLLRQYAHRDWARYGEVHGMPIRGCKVPATAAESDKSHFYEQFARLGNESTIELPQGMDGQSFGLELIEATGGHWEAFDRLIGQCNIDIACAVLGQNLTTEVQGGSFAAATAHGRVRQDYLEADARLLSAALQAQVLRPWAAFNFGHGGLAPCPVWDTTPPEDRVQQAQMLQACAEALTKLLALGMPVDVVKFAQQYKIPLKSQAVNDRLGVWDPSVYSYGLVTRNEARARLGLPPIAGGDELITPTMGMGVPTLQALSNRRREEESEKKWTPHEIAQSAQSQAASVLSSDVQAMEESIKDASCEEEVRERVRAAYDQMDSGSLAEDLTQALLLAHLVGRSSLHQAQS